MFHIDDIALEQGRLSKVQMNILQRTGTRLIGERLPWPVPLLKNV